MADIRFITPMRRREVARTDLDEVRQWNIFLESFLETVAALRVLERGEEEEGARKLRRVVDVMIHEARKKKGTNNVDRTLSAPEGGKHNEKDSADRA